MAKPVSKEWFIANQDAAYEHYVNAWHKARARSPEHLRRFHAWVKKLHNNIPDEQRQLFKTPNRLRYRLMCDAGHAKVEEFDFARHMPPELWRELAIGWKRLDEKVFITMVGDTIRVEQAQSVAFDKMSQDEFYQAESDMVEAAYRRFEIDIDQLMEPAA